MEWIRYHPKASAIIAGIATLLIIVMVWSWIGPSDEEEEPNTFGTGIPTQTPTPLPTTTPTASPTKSVEDRVGQGLKGIPGSGGNVKGGSIELPGLSGGSMYSSLPKHRLVLRVTSQAPIGVVGYIIPTSLQYETGVVKNVGTSWSLTTTVYGEPDYAQLFLQAGARGYPITCTVSVDGKVTEQRSTEGPYGQMLCQG